MADFKQLGLVSIGELCGKDLLFYIPDYQRGYRWTKSQVEDLLEDIADFMQNGKSDEYCLQPLVVAKRAEKEYVVIDGQQRLTTLRLLLGRLGLVDEKAAYQIDYQTRERSKEFILKLVSSEASPCAPEAAENDIDSYHMWQAYLCIDDWFKEKSDHVAAAFRETLLKQVKFIWYCTAEDPVAVFRRLNVGKIGLTDSELIKALLLNRSYVNEAHDDRLSVFQQEIALQWDMVENALGEDEFWYFLTEEEPSPTRIDLIFRLIYEAKACGKGDWDAYDTFKPFRYFHAYIRDKDTESTCYERIRTIWSEVMERYLLFREWFSDATLYHYVGFLLSKTGKKRIKEIHELWKQGDRKTFLQTIRQQVWKVCLSGKCHTKPLKEDIPEIRCLESCRTLSQVEFKHRLMTVLREKVVYFTGAGDKKRDSIPLLLLHNIQTLIIQNRNAQKHYKLGVFSKFPFHLYNRVKWEVEHIDSNTTNELTDKKSREEYLFNLYALLKERPDHEEIRVKLNQFVLSENAKEQNQLFAELQKTMQQKLQCGGAAEEKNAIQNYALLDESTNSSYGNALFPLKRKMLIERDRGLALPGYVWEEGDLKEIPAPGKAGIAFVPPCTMAAFLKKYSGHNANPNLWAEADASAYLDDLCEKLTDFIYG